MTHLLNIKQNKSIDNILDINNKIYNKILDIKAIYVNASIGNDYL